MDAQDERWTLYQKSVVAIATLAIVFDGFDNQVLGFATPALMKECGITSGAMAPIAAIGLIGMRRRNHDRWDPRRLHWTVHRADRRGCIVRLDDLFGKEVVRDSNRRFERIQSRG